MSFSQSNLIVTIASCSRYLSYLETAVCPSISCNAGARHVDVVLYRGCKKRWTLHINPRYLSPADRLRSQWIAKSAPLKSDAQSERAEGIIHKCDPTISQRFTSATIPEPAIEGSPECLVGEQWHSRHGRPTSKCVRTQGLRIDWKREGGVRCPRLARRRWDA